MQVDTSLNTVNANIQNVVIAGASLTANPVNYVLQDLQGSTRAVMSGTSVVARHDFLPFGEEIAVNVGMRPSAQGFKAVDSLGLVPDRIRQRYAMTERDDTSGLDHTWWRKYENRSGRWTSPDPYLGSMTIGDPQSFNRFAYVRNDPVNLVDPSGLTASGVWSAEFSSCGDDNWANGINGLDPSIWGNRTSDLVGFGTDWGSWAGLGESDYEERLQNTYDAIAANRALERYIRSEGTDMEALATLQALLTANSTLS